jgi:hypothetical protein
METTINSSTGLFGIVVAEHHTNLLKFETDMSTDHIASDQRIPAHIFRTVRAV